MVYGWWRRTAFKICQRELRNQWCQTEGGFRTLLYGGENPGYTAGLHNRVEQQKTVNSPKVSLEGSIDH